MTDRITLDQLESSYRRVTRELDRMRQDTDDLLDETIAEALKDGAETVYDELTGVLRSTIERDRRVVDAAFFILIFGQLENRINSLATRRQQRPEERIAMRDRPFERRLDHALPGTDKEETRKEIKNWYDLRNYVAHGERIGSGYNIAEVLRRARELENELGSE